MANSTEITAALPFLTPDDINAIIELSTLAGGLMANLIVRNIDQKIVDALKARAGKYGRSAEAEHRTILESVLLKPRRKTFTEVLQDIPDVGNDDDFERLDDSGDRDVFN